jgi:UDP-glucose 4-epimerase
MKIKGSKLLVIGGAGFVGSHLTDALLDMGATVQIIDDFSNGNMANLEQVKDRVVIKKHDITLPLDQLKKAVGDFKYDGIFHLACWPRQMSLKNPHRDVEVNAYGTINVLELARARGVKMVFTSNSGIYGEPEYLPMDEKHPDKPSTPYDANKLVSEYYMKIYHNIYRLPIGICRLATVYGDRQRAKPDWKPVIPEFASKVQHGEAPVIYWDGEQTRDLIYVKDVVQGLTKAFESDKTDNEVFLLSTGKETSINEIYRIVCRELGVNIEPKRAEKVPGDIRRMILSNAKANKTFGFKPDFNLEHGIKAYIKWFKAQK